MGMALRAVSNCPRHIRKTKTVSITVCVFISPVYITALCKRILVYARCSLVHAVIARIPIQLGGRCTVFFFLPASLCVHDFYSIFFFSVGVS